MLLGCLLHRALVFCILCFVLFLVLYGQLPLKLSLHYVKSVPLTIYNNFFCDLVQVAANMLNKCILYALAPNTLPQISQKIMTRVQELQGR